MKSILCGLVLASVAFVAGCGGHDDGRQGPVPDALATIQASAAPSVGSLLKATGPIPQNGFWWNPAESGRGYALEVQGNQIFMGAYMYEASGVPTWYLATLVQQADGAFKGTLNRYSGGQTLLGAYQAPSTITAIATASLAFASPSAGSLTVVMSEGGASRTIPIQRLGFSNPPFAAPVGAFQGGLWWNAAEGGRGYFVEVQGNQAYIGSFMYDASGQPVWYLTAATIQNEDTMQGVLQQFAGGQSLAGNYRAAAPQAGNAGNVTFAVTSSTTANLTLPDGKLLAISRASTASVDACASVKPGFAGDIETTPAGNGGDSAGADGGGAAAGGGLGKVLGGLMRVVDLSDNTLIGEAVTDSTLGLVTVKTCARPGPFLLTLEGRAGAKYFDEGLNQLTDFGPGNVLHALVDKWDEHVGVSPLTEAAYRYALNNHKRNPADIAAGRAGLVASGGLVGITAAQVAAANGLVASQMNARVTINYQLASSKSLPTPIDQSSSSGALKNSRYGRSAAVNGGLVKAANDYNPYLTAPGLALADQLARDLTDGRIDGFALDGLQVAPAGQSSYESVRLTLAGSIATNALASRFGATTLLPTELRVDEESYLGIVGSEPQYTRSGGASVPCDGFSDDAALMSDGSVTVLRRFPTNVAGVCSYKYDVAENARMQKLSRFVTDVKKIATANSVIFAIKRDGTMLGWGENHCGRMSPTLPNRIYATPQVLPGLKNITSIGASFSGVIVRDATGGVFTWGARGAVPPVPSSAKVCGTGNFPSPDEHLEFTKVQDDALIAQTQLRNVAEVYAHSATFFALTTDGALYGWGSGAGGLLANSDGVIREGQLISGPSIELPERIQGLGAVRKVVFGVDTIYALQTDGTVKAWGSDKQKLLGNGTQLGVARPTTIAGLTGVANIESSYAGIRLQKTDGTVWVWNSENSIGAKWPLYVPTLVSTPEPVRYIASRLAGFTVYFSSGRVAHEVDATDDIAASYR